MTKQGVGALPLYALKTKDMLNFSISLTVMHHIHLTVTMEVRGANQMVFISFP